MDEIRTPKQCGYIENLAALGIGDETVDVVISNCVINLSHEKRSCIQGNLQGVEARRRAFFSDVFADRRIPESISLDPLLRGECLGGAMYVEDFRLWGIRLFRE